MEEPSLAPTAKEALEERRRRSAGNPMSSLSARWCGDDNPPLLLLLRRRCQSDRHCSSMCAELEDSTNSPSRRPG